MTINKAPAEYSPVNNPVIFQITSNAFYFVYFLVKVLDEFDNTLASQKYYALPNYRNGSYFDLSSILSNLVDFQLVNSDTISEPTPLILKSYKLEITDYQMEYQGAGDGVQKQTGNIISNEIITTELYNVWCGGLNRIDFNKYEQFDYVGGNGYISRYLTNKPLLYNVYKDSTEYLYFLNTTSGNRLKFNFYGRSGLLLGTQYVPVSDEKAQRLNVSPQVVADHFGHTFNDIYGDQFSNVFQSQFGQYATAIDSNYYTVTIIDNSGTAKTETRTYILKDTTCRVSFQLLFSNDLGGYDTLSLFDPKQTISNAKTSMSNYAYQMIDGEFTNESNGVFNSTTTVIKSTNTVSYKAVTGVVSDQDSVWIKGIISAEKVYLRLNNGVFFPVSISTTSYNIQSKKYSTNNNRLELEFTSDVVGLFE